MTSGINMTIIYMYNCPPYLLTQALRPGEVTPASFYSVGTTREVVVYRL